MRKSFLSGSGVVLLIIGCVVALPHRTWAACAAAADYGAASSTLTVPADATYHIWSRLMVPDTSHTTYALEVDGTNCFVVGQHDMPAHIWGWVNSQPDTADKIALALSAGPHTLRFIGMQPGVKLDRVIATSDAGCVPQSATGVECQAANDDSAPRVSITQPAINETLSGAATVQVTASDTVGISKVELYVNNSLRATSTTSPYSFMVNTQLFANDTATLTAKAYDTAGNSSTDNRSVLIANTTASDNSQPAALLATPRVPSKLTATVANYSQVDLAWEASATQARPLLYDIFRKTGLAAFQKIATVPTTSFGDTTLRANTTYEYYIKAHDDSGNISDQSNTASATTFHVIATGKLTGMVRDSHGQAIPYARLSLKLEDRRLIFIADSHGQYHTGSIPSGPQALSVSAPGYEPVSLHPTVGEHTTQEITLRKK